MPNREPVLLAFMLQTTAKIMIFAGGIPLKRDGKVVGAIGVIGGSGDQDHAVAAAGAARLTRADEQLCKRGGLIHVASLFWPGLPLPPRRRPTGLTDLYAFPKPGDANKSILIMNVHPSAGENPVGRLRRAFRTQALYELRLMPM